MQAMPGCKAGAGAGWGSSPGLAAAGWDGMGWEAIPPGREQLLPLPPACSWLSLALVQLPSCIVCSSSQAGCAAFAREHPASMESNTVSLRAGQEQGDSRLQLLLCRAAACTVLKKAIALANV